MTALEFILLLGESFCRPYSASLPKHWVNDGKNPRETVTHFVFASHPRIRTCDPYLTSVDLCVTIGVVV